MLHKTDTVLIFSDAATSPQMRIAVGAFICLDQNQLPQYVKFNLEELYSNLQDVIQYQRYHSKKSTESEIKTVIIALNSIANNYPAAQHIIIYTDCQSLCDVLGRRRAKLLQNNFITRQGKVLQNADLYQALYHIADQFQIETVKIKGHQKKSLRVSVEEKIFTVLDTLSRKKLREEVSSL